MSLTQKPSSGLDSLRTNLRDMGMLYQLPQPRTEVNSAEEQSTGLELDDTDSLLHELNTDLLYLFSRAEAANKKRYTILARRAPMNRFPIEVCSPIPLN